jgi:hypothetical protein
MARYRGSQSAGPPAAAASISSACARLLKARASSGVRRSALSRATSASAAGKRRKKSATTAGAGNGTRQPTCGTISSNPSVASRAAASRIGCQLVSRRRAISPIGAITPGRRRPVEHEQAQVEPRQRLRSNKVLDCGCLIGKRAEHEAGGRNIASAQPRNDDPGGFSANLLRIGICIGVIRTKQGIDQISRRIEVAQLHRGRPGALRCGAGNRAGLSEADPANGAASMRSSFLTPRWSEMDSNV